MASRTRRAVYRLATPLDRVLRRSKDLLLPPAHLRLYYYNSLAPEAFAQACRNTRAELMTRGLQPQHRVLDIGSGIGNLAIGLVDYLQGGYDGVEIHPEAVAWCQHHITPRHRAFRFHRADVESSAYNPSGRGSATMYRFPFPDRAFDFIVLASVFTHMFPEQVETYLQEIARLLAPEGKCLASFFLLNDETRAGVEAGQSFLSFQVNHASGLCRLHDAAVPEAAVAIEERFVLELLGRTGLRIAEARRGSWWRGTAHDQDLLTIVLNS
ncbi:MAG: class I SAM-dependent methyltransferase [Acidobacteriota bacterium]|nr:class I SAM-dependent methyltransferase [Acidobacteriota bacterium]